MHKKILLATAVATVIFSGCSSKQYFEPKQTSSLSTSSMGDKIVHYTRDGATLASGTILTNSESVKLKLEKGFYFINNNKKAAITADLKGNCNIVTQTGTAASAKFPSALVAGTIIGKYLVYVLQNNNFGLYDFEAKKIVFNKAAKRAYAIDRRIANPLQVDKLVVIPTLDGKLVILDLTTQKINKEVYVSTESSLNNVIFLGQLNNALIAATPNKVLSLSNKGKKELDKSVSEVTINNGDLFLFSKDGNMFKLNELLSIVNEKKFKFAHFSIAGVASDKVFGVDKQGYLIVANRNLSKHKVYKTSEIDGFAFISGSKLYNNQEVIDLSNLNYE